MRKLNIETIIKLLVFLGLVAFYYIIVVSGMVNLYVHPRILPFIKVSMVFMVIISLFLVLSIFKVGIIKKKKRSYAIFLIPLIMTLGMGSDAVTPSLLEKPNFDIRKEISLKNKEIDHSGHDHSKEGHEGVDELDTNNKQIVVEDKNYMFFLNEAYNDHDEYLGKEIEITGFIYKDDSLKKNELVLLRVMMVCCSADTQIVGLMCDYEGASKFNNDTWVRGVGVLEESDSLEGVILNIKSLEKVNKPKNEYVYPY
ncbi:MAG TPA: TIGR03943 family protein [Clostridium sp.]